MSCKEQNRKYPVARFWDYINGDYVKLNIYPGDCLRWHTSSPTDEGWNSETIEYHYGTDNDGLIIYVIHETDGCDCDGRLSRHYEWLCPIEALRDGQPMIIGYDKNGVGIDSPTEFMPEWIKTTSCQRDYSAEAMGY